MNEIKATLGSLPSFGASLKGITVTKAPDITSHEQLSGRDLPNQHPASAISGISEAIESALGEAKASGMFDGKDGVTITKILIESNEDTGAETKIITFSDGQVIRIADGEPGAEGVGVSIRDIMHNETTGQHILTFTDGTQLTVSDGKDGTDGAPGKDGADGKDYVLTDADKAELAQMAADTVDVPTALKNPNALTINGERYDGSAAVSVNIKEELEPLIGTTADITPEQVAEAIVNGRDLAIIHDVEGIGETAFCYFSILLSPGLIISSGVGTISGETVTLELCGDLDEGTWSCNMISLAKSTDIPQKLANPYPLIINGAEYDGSASAVVDIGLEALTGTTDEVTPTQVAEALHRGRSIVLTTSVTGLGNVTFNHFLYSGDANAVFSSAVLKYGDELKCAEIRGAISGNTWTVYTSDVAQKSDLPTALPNPNTLSINGTAYDGSKAVEVATTSMTVAFSLTDGGGVASETDMDTVLWMLRAKRSVTARLTTKGGTYLGAGTFNLVESAVSTKAVADVMTTEGIYRITAESTQSDYKVDYLLYTASAGGTVIFEESTISSTIVSGLALQLDMVYDVYWNGILYTCTSYESESQVYTGNGSIINSNLPDTGEPFLITNAKGATSCMVHKSTGQASSNTLMVATHGYKVSGDGIDVVADVGQTIVVEEIDAAGKPTKWRAMDFPKISVVSVKEFDENDMPIMNRTSTEMQSDADNGYLIFLSLSGMLCVPTSNTSGSGEDFVMEFVCVGNSSLVFDINADGKLILQ